MSAARAASSAFGGCDNRSFRDLSAVPVDGDDRVRPLVRIDPDDDHVRCLLLEPWVDDEDRPADTPK